MVDYKIRDIYILSLLFIPERRVSRLSELSSLPVHWSFSYVTLVTIPSPSCTETPSCDQVRTENCLPKSLLHCKFDSKLKVQDRSSTFQRQATVRI